MYKILLFIFCSAVTACNSTYRLTRTAKPVTATDDVWSTSNVGTFEKKLEALRIRYHIPSLAVGIVNEKKLVVSGGRVMLI
ncbi:hypothetical protein [Terrimonas alba]|uniref:hypothetical protein n=1 Tax=Terrimonas alba TaxID=3349636 RepID=UPI0036DACACC